MNGLTRHRDQVRADIEALVSQPRVADPQRGPRWLACELAAARAKDRERTR